MVPFAIIWHRGAGLACVGLVSTFLSGDICPKPEVLGVRLVFCTCRCVSVLRLRASGAAHFSLWLRVLERLHILLPARRVL